MRDDGQYDDLVADDLLDEVFAEANPNSARVGCPPREEQNQPAQPPLLLPRARVRATILLAVGSEPGPYRVQVLDGDMNTRASATGAAVIRNFVTTLEADLDLRALTPGAYQLGVRREDEDWRLFFAQVTQDGRP
jgi:hypothetical protein